PNADLHLRQIPGNKQPTYPWMARLRRLEGEVVLNLHVSSTGKVTEVQLAQSTHEVFSKECLEAVKGWKFQTPVQSGWYAKPFRFQLKGYAKEKPTLLRRKNN